MCKLLFSSSENLLGQVSVAKGRWMSTCPQCWTQPFFSLLAGREQLLGWVPSLPEPITQKMLLWMLPMPHEWMSCWMPHGDLGLTTCFLCVFLLGSIVLPVYVDECVLILAQQNHMFIFGNSEYSISSLENSTRVQPNSMEASLVTRWLLCISFSSLSAKQKDYYFGLRSLHIQLVLHI